MTNQYESLKISLQNLGLSEKESNIYISLLILGKGTVSEISKKASINRTTGYDVLNYLLQKGLVNVSGKEPKQEYTAESPNKIIDFLNNQILETQNKIQKANELISDLSLLHNYKNRPKIRFYEGIDGLKTVYEDTLTSSEEIRAYATVDDMHNALPNYFPEYYKRRAKNNIFIRAIVPSTDIGKERHSYDKDEKREIALVPADKYYFSPEINIYDNKVMIASWREKLGIIIESEEIADAMKKIYELAWDRSKEFPENK